MTLLPQDLLAHNSKRGWIIKLISLLVVIAIAFLIIHKTNRAPIHAPINQVTIKLPMPVTSSKISIEAALMHRRSNRVYKDEPVPLKQVSQLLWAAQGITSHQGFRTAPSAGALYPLEIFILCGNVEGLHPGLYQYKPESHSLLLVDAVDKRLLLAEAALNQSPIKLAPIDIIITAIYARTTKKYGERGVRFAILEAGHVSQNIYLQAVSQNIGTVALGGFDDAKVKAVLGLATKQDPLYIMPVGIPAHS